MSCHVRYAMSRSTLNESGRAPLSGPISGSGLRLAVIGHIWLVRSRQVDKLAAQTLAGLETNDRISGWPNETTMTSEEIG